MADSYYNTSPYAFCGNNPVNLVDPDGKAVEPLWDIVSVASGIKNLVRNIKDHNAKGAVDDVAGMAIAGKSYRAEQQVRIHNYS